MQKFDIAVIGGGPAGVSAAVTARARNKKVAVFSAGGIGEKVSRAQSIKNYTGLPDITGDQLKNALNAHLKALDIPLYREQVTNVYALTDRFAVNTSKNVYESEAVILATGIIQGRTLEGEEEFLGRGVSYCATCDGNFYRQKDIAVLGYNTEAKAETEYLAGICKTVYYFPLNNIRDFSAQNITVMSAKPLRITGTKKAENLITDEGALAVDGIFLLKDAVNPKILVPGLAVEDGHITVDLWMKTNLPGCFACGDAAGKPYQYIKAAGQGNVAALSAISFLENKLKS